MVRNTSKMSLNSYIALSNEIASFSKEDIELLSAQDRMYLSSVISKLKNTKKSLQFTDQQISNNPMRPALRLLEAQQL